MEFKDLVKDAYYYDKTGMLLKGDCIEWMEKFPDKSVDMILADLPYGTTSCKWDTVISFSLLWKQYERIIVDNGAIVLTASQPFTSNLVMSKIELFKYSWAWIKNSGADFMMAKNKPLNRYEDIIVFSKANFGTDSKNRMKYFPQDLIEINKKSLKSNVSGKRNGNSDFVPNRTQKIRETLTTHTNYPVNVLVFDKDGKLHPTQKPVALFEYLIKTYSSEGEIVLDNTAGSCTTAVASRNTNRNWICIEKEEKYCQVSKERLMKNE